jgi:hypothetical protein
MNPNLTIKKFDFEGWNKVIKELSRISGKSFKEIIRLEAGEILHAASKSKMTKLGSIKNIAENWLPLTVNWGGYVGKKYAYTLKAGEAGVEKNTTYLLRHKIKPSVWEYIKNKQLDSVKERGARVGMNKGQFLAMSKLLGLRSSKPFPQEAKSFYNKRKNTISKRVYALERGKGKKYEIEVGSYLSELFKYAGSGKALKNTVRNRYNKFKRAMTKGTLNEVKKRTRAYPLIFGKS